MIISRKEYARLKKMSYEDMNKFLNNFYQSAYKEGMNADVDGEQLSKDELFKAISRVQGVGMITANKIVKEIFK